MHSPAHNKNDAVSNRIFEAAAAGSVIITDKNKYIEKYFGDSVYYIDYSKSKEEQIEDIKRYIEEINNNPDASYEKACKAQEIFKKELAFDPQIEKIINHLYNEKIKLIEKENPDIIDVICYVDNNNELLEIKRELDKQYYKNLNVIVLSKNDLDKTLAPNYNYPEIPENAQLEGELFIQALKYLKGNYFMIMNGFSALHKNHINKLYDSLSKRDNLFAYAGTYIRYEDNKSVINYETINKKALNPNEFLSFLRPDINKTEMLFQIEECFSYSCALFKKEILKYMNNSELELMSNSVHLYLAICSILKAKTLGHYITTISSGYKLNPVQDISAVFAKAREYYLEYQRSECMALKDLCIVFYKYDVPINECTIEIKKLSKEQKILKSCQNKKYRKLVCHITGGVQKDKDILKFLYKHKRLKNFLYILQILLFHGKYCK